MPGRHVSLGGGHAPVSLPPGAESGRGRQLTTTCRHNSEVSSQPPPSARYTDYFTHGRPHQGRQQRIPAAAAAGMPQAGMGGRVQATPILGGLHHTYQRAA